MANDETLNACPFCGSTHTGPSKHAAYTGMLVGGMAGAGYTVNRLINKPFPVLASALITGCVLGLIWGAQVGRAIGGTLEEALGAKWRCAACGREFER